MNWNQSVLRSDTKIQAKLSTQDEFSQIQWVVFGWWYAQWQVISIRDICQLKNTAFNLCRQIRSICFCSQISPRVPNKKLVLLQFSWRKGFKDKKSLSSFVFAFHLSKIPRSFAGIPWILDPLNPMNGTIITGYTLYSKLTPPFIAPKKSCSESPAVLVLASRLHFDSQAFNQ